MPGRNLPAMLPEFGTCRSCLVRLSNIKPWKAGFCMMIRFRGRILLFVLTYFVYKQRDWAVPDDPDQALTLI